VRSGDRAGQSIGARQRIYWLRKVMYKTENTKRTENTQNNIINNIINERI
jgi:hypothetical protein